MRPQALIPPIRHIAVRLCLLALAGLIVLAGCNAQTEQPPTGGLGSPPDYHGVAPVEESIAWADVIARVELLSVTAVAEQQTGETDYIAALDYRFRVLEYLRGSGGTELVAMVDDVGETFSSSGSAVTRAEALKERRDTQWDGRQAIVFLEDAVPALPSTSQADRYWLGALSFHNPWEDYYTIASRWEKRWLPAAASGAGGASGSSDTQRFLLDAPAPSGGAGGAAGQSEGTPTITLTTLKTKIATNTAAIAAGGGSEEYKDCLYLKLKWAREVQYRVDSRGGSYFYIRHDATLGSGLTEGTIAFTDPFGSELPATPPPDAGDFQLTSNDAALFRWEWPRFTHTVRPLPAREYKFYYSPRPKKYIICDGTPDPEKKRQEVFVTVTAPAGALHEAFFDPVTIGATVGADASNGVLKPTDFSIGDASTSVSGLKWQNNKVILTFSTFNALQGHRLDFIELDGSVSLSLLTDTAAQDSAAKTLTWDVPTQPWHDGDLLMLRIREDTAEPSGG